MYLYNIMHYNWPYGLYAILTIGCISLVFFGASSGIIGICGAYVNSFCILCRFISEERARRVERATGVGDSN